MTRIFENTNIFKEGENITLTDTPSKSIPRPNIYVQPKETLSISENDNEDCECINIFTEESNKGYDWIPFIIVSSTILGFIYLSE
jgi:hypothetical protein